MAGCTVFCLDFQTLSWRNWSDCSFRDDLAVFRFELDEHVVISPTIQSLLQADEQQRAERFHRVDDRRRFIYSRAILRILAGQYTHQSPEEIRFTTGPNNKPILAGDTGWHINLSHSGNYILLAIGTVSVGVDVEKQNPEFSFQDILSGSFSAEEQTYITNGPDSLSRFYQLWTRKEAILKATGKGMNDDFCRIPSLSGQHVVTSELTGGVGNWLVASFAAAPDYPAAVAYQEMKGKPIFYTLNSVLFEH